MNGYFALVLHAHLPFIRHPKHERFLEETWLFEAILETYIPLLRVFERWLQDGLPVRITLTVTPTLCAMLNDELLRARCARHITELIELAEREVHRSLWLPAERQVAEFYRQRLLETQAFYESRGRDLVSCFRKLRDLGVLEIITSSATHAVLPLLAGDQASLRAQVLTGCASHLSCFGQPPEGIWLPECAYAPEIEPVLREAGLHWFILDTHGLLHAQPRPRYAIFAPVVTESGLAAFGRDMASARQLWSRNEGYPGDARYREFYRDVGFDRDWDYIRSYLAAPTERGYTGLKFHRITGPGPEKEIYSRDDALRAVAEHARHFMQGRVEHFTKISRVMPQTPVLVAPYDAELFGHWWFEGPEFLDQFVRQSVAGQDAFGFITPGDYLRLSPFQQASVPGTSSWGEGGYWSMWLSEENAWVRRHLHTAQLRMSELAAHYRNPGALQRRALNQAARELLLAQASDWPFILRAGTSTGYAQERLTTHLVRFNRLYGELRAGQIQSDYLAEIEAEDNIFPALDFRIWKQPE